MSIGLPWLQCGGRNSLSARIVVSDKLGQFASAGEQRIGREHARAAGVGDDG